VRRSTELTAISWQDMTSEIRILLSVAAWRDHGHHGAGIVDLECPTGRPSSLSTLSSLKSASMCSSQIIDA